ncbi:MAG: hypothetical protein Q9198_006784 [Flavoplaca austrocitrina]
MAERRPLLKGRLRPPVKFPSHPSYAQSTFTRGDIVVKDRGKEPKPHITIFSSQKTAQPFLDPAIMARRNASMTKKA